MNDPYSDLEDRLAEALRARTQHVEPADDSFVRLEQRITAEHRAVGPARGSRRVPPRYLAAAAVFLVAVGSAAVLVSNQGGSQLEAVGPTSSNPSNTVVDEPTTRTTEDDVEPFVIAPLTTAPREYLAAPVAGPQGATVEDAAVAFLDLLAIDHAGVEVDGMRVGVRTFTEDRQVGDVVVWLDVFESEPNSGESGYSVTRATSDHVSITSPGEGSENILSPLVVAGIGEGFEATLSVRLVSASDGSLLASTFTAGGSYSEAKPYTAELDVQGAERAWIVVSGGGEADNVLDDFAAIPITYLAGELSTVYAVSNIPAGDPDGGLLVRDLPSVENGAVLVTLPPDTSGVRRLARVPAIVGDQVWWEITVSLDGESYVGWVNRRYLADPNAEASPTVTDAELDELGRRFHSAGYERDLETLRSLPWTTSRPLEAGWIGAPVEFTGEALGSELFWTESRLWTLPGEFDPPETTLSLLSLLELPDRELVDVGYELDAMPISPYGGDQAAIGTKYDNARTVTIFDSQPDTPWRHTTLVVVPTATGPEIIAVLLTVWIP